MTQKPNEILKCPHCLTEQDAIAEDFVIPGRVGKESRADDICYECNKQFSCERQLDGLIAVEEL